ncbi:MAG: enoyl-CoA hydratase/isomerase family protein, partial [Porticoccaceae bacterium]|nr:enoyl-CoA hydratase/isomerase family protein [Porticoccaceae bacterium]
MSDLSSSELPATQSLILERDKSVLKIWFNRPEAKNALSAKMTEELHTVLDAVCDDRSIRTIVLRGAGGVFCAGGDIKGFKSGMQATDADEVA